MATEKVKLKGRVVLTVKDAKGKVKEKRIVENVVTDVGKAAVAGLINGLVTAAFKYIAIGTGTTSPSASDTALESEVKRKEASVDRATTNVTNDTAVLTASFSKADGLTGTMAVTESGVFNAGSGGDMLARVVFDALNMNWDAGDTLTVEWRIQVG